MLWPYSYKYCHNGQMPFTGDRRSFVCLGYTHELLVYTYSHSITVHLGGCSLCVHRNYCFSAFLVCHLLGESLQPSHQAASKKRESEALKQRPVRGEYKVWIYKNYLAASLFFLLAANTVPDPTVSDPYRAAPQGLSSSG